MYSSTLLEDYLATNDMLPADRVSTPLVTIGILVFWLGLWQLGGFLIRRHLSNKDWISRIEQLIDREMDALKRADELLAESHVDLAIIQFHKAVLTRLQMACLKRGVYRGDPIADAKKAGIVNKTNKRFLETILVHYAVAESTHPAEPSAGTDTAEATKQFLSTIAV